MLNKISLKNEIPFRNLSIEFKNITLFTGINGSGKTKLIHLIDSYSKRYFQDNSLNGQIGKWSETDPLIPYSEYFTYLDEERGIIRMEDGTSSGNLTALQRVLQAPTSLIVYENEVLFQKFNEIFFQLFKRKLRKNPRIVHNSKPYYMKNGKEIELENDGRGILNVIIILMTILVKLENTILVIEEPSLGLWPSKTYEFLRIICSLAIEKNIQLIFTTQDVVVCSLFCNEINNEYIKIHKFEDNDGELNIIPVDKDNVHNILEDFFNYSNFQSDFKIFD